MTPEPKPPPLRILFLIPSLERGGAERQAVVLAKALAARGHVVHIATFYPGGAFAEDLAGSGVQRHSLDKRGRWDLGSLLRLRRIISDARAQVVYAWLSTANLAAGVVRAVIPGLRLVWTVNDAGALTSELGTFARMVLGLENQAARFADLVVVNSEAGRARCLERGFPSSKLRVVPNGIDPERFSPNPAARARVRSELGIAESAVVVGIVARLDPIKDHSTFLRAAAEALAVRPDLRFVAVGGGEPAYERNLRELAQQLGIASYVHWLGSRDDVPAVLNAFDVGTLTSIAEGFPNAVAEAMATGVPCVVTDVGDCAFLVGRADGVTPRRSPTALAQAWLHLANLSFAERTALGATARSRILSSFSPVAFARGVENALRSLLVDPSRSAPDRPEALHGRN
jgi:glycosyltransferase involved in cell wall biosynthesis